MANQPTHASGISRSIVEHISIICSMDASGKAPSVGRGVIFPQLVTLLLRQQTTNDQQQQYNSEQLLRHASVASSETAKYVSSATPAQLQVGAAASPRVCDATTAAAVSMLSLMPPKFGVHDIIFHQVTLYCSVEVSAEFTKLLSCTHCLPAGLTDPRCCGGFQGGSAWSAHAVHQQNITIHCFAHLQV